MISYMFMADGFEEVEALATVDVLRRAGMPVVTLSLNSGTLEVTGAHGIKVLADQHIEDAPTIAEGWLILPGGMPGASNIRDNERAKAWTKAHAEAGGKVAAICASPAVALAPWGVINGQLVTCYPGFERDCEAHGATVDNEARAVVSDNIVTGAGPACALDFALTIVAETLGEGKAQEVAAGMLVDR